MQLEEFYNYLIGLRNSETVFYKAENAHKHYRVPNDDYILIPVGELSRMLSCQSDIGSLIQRLYKTETKFPRLLEVHYEALKPLMDKIEEENA